MVLKKDVTLFERDEKGELLPKEVDILVDENDFEQAPLKGEKIIITPLTRGELKKFFSDVAILGERRKNLSVEERQKFDEDFSNDLDAQIILKHCHEPKYAKKDLEFMKTGAVIALVNTILFESGIDVRRKSRREALKEVEDEFAKN